MAPSRPIGKWTWALCITSKGLAVNWYNEATRFHQYRIEVSKDGQSFTTVLIGRIIGPSVPRWMPLRWRPGSCASPLPAHILAVGLLFVKCGCTVSSTRERP